MLDKEFVEIIKPILGMEGYIVETLQRFDEKDKIVLRMRKKDNESINQTFREYIEYLDK